MSSSLLLLDSRAVASTKNAKLELRTVRKCPANPLFVEEYFADPPKPWEARLDNVYPSVIYDEEDGVYKCWYKSFIYDEASNRTPREQRPHQPYGESKREEALLYAVSSDGIRWRKPALGIIDFEGSRANNLVMRKATHGIHAGGVFKDLREPDPARRYKFLHRNARARRMASCFSADGTHWSLTVLWNEHDAVGDCHNNAIWSPELNRYVGITRGWSDGIRTVLRSESSDFLNWSQPHEIMRGAVARDQIYSLPICRYRDFYIGLPSVFHKGDPAADDWDTVDTELALSADTLTWERICPAEDLIPRGAGQYPDGEYDCGCIYAAAPLALDDKILIYYGGSNGLHNNWREGSFNLATLDIDRFAGFVPQESESAATLVTTPLRLRQAGLTINAEVQSGGWIRAGLLDGNGNAVEGFGLDDCLPVVESGMACDLRWRKDRCVPDESESVPIVFDLCRAKLYALNGANRD